MKTFVVELYCEASENIHAHLKDLILNFLREKDSQNPKASGKLH